MRGAACSLARCPIVAGASSVHPSVWATLSQPCMPTSSRVVADTSIRCSSQPMRQPFAEEWKPILRPRRLRRCPTWARGMGPVESCCEIARSAVNQTACDGALAFIGSHMSSAWACARPRRTLRRKQPGSSMSCLRRPSSSPRRHPVCPC